MRSSRLNVPILLAAAQTQSVFELLHSGGVHVIKPGCLLVSVLFQQYQFGFTNCVRLA